MPRCRKMSPTLTIQVGEATLPTNQIDLAVALAGGRRQAIAGRGIFGNEVGPVPACAGHNMPASNASSPSASVTREIGTAGSLRSG